MTSRSSSEQQTGGRNCQCCVVQCPLTPAKISTFEQLWRVRDNVPFVEMLPARFLTMDQYRYWMKGKLALMIFSDT